jgi:hypothetical protein
LAALWVVSIPSPYWIGYTRPTQHAYSFGHDRWRFGIDQGCVVLMIGGVEGLGKESEDWLHGVGTSQGYSVGWQIGSNISDKPGFGSMGFAGPRRFSFRSQTGHYPQIAEYGSFTAIPFWIFIVASSLPFQVAWIRGQVKRLHESRIGLCPVCGYDLRATPDRCPECGTAVVNPSHDPPMRRPNSL